MSDPRAAYDSMLNAGIVALRAGQNEQARNLLRQVVRSDPGNERAWLFLAGALNDNTQRRYCLEQVLSINPQSVPASKGLSALAAAAQRDLPPQVAVISEPRISSPVPLKAEEPTSQQIVVSPSPAPRLEARSVEPLAPEPTPPPAAAPVLPPAASLTPAAFSLPMLSARFEPTASVEPPIVAPLPVAAVAPTLPAAQLSLPLNTARPANQVVWGILLALGLVLMFSSTIYTVLLLRG